MRILYFKKLIVNVDSIELQFDSPYYMGHIVVKLKENIRA